MDHRRQLMDVDHDPVAEPDRIGRPIDKNTTWLTKTPQGSSETGFGLRFRGVGPQPSSQTGPRLRSFAKGQTGKHSLLGQGEVD